jgi:hypothetical protein
VRKYAATDPPYGPRFSAQIRPRSTKNPLVNRLYPIQDPQLEPSQVVLARRFEGPWTRVPGPVKATMVALSAAFGLYVVAVL